MECLTLICLLFKQSYIVIQIILGSTKYQALLFTEVCTGANGFFLWKEKTHEIIFNQHFLLDALHLQVF